MQGIKLLSTEYWMDVGQGYTVVEAYFKRGTGGEELVEVQKPGTDVYRSFTWVYVVFRIVNKRSICPSNLQVFSIKYFHKDENSPATPPCMQYICLINQR